MNDMKRDMDSWDRERRARRFVYGGVLALVSFVAVFAVPTVPLTLLAGCGFFAGGVMLMSAL